MRILPLASLLLCVAQAAPALDLSDAYRSAGRLLASAPQPDDKPRSAVWPGRRCSKEDAAGPKVYSSDFRWGLSLPELVTLFQKMYASPKRLPKRAYWNEQTERFELPYDEARGGAAVLPESFVRAVTRHIERAYELDYIDAVFFPDMGHSHFLIPQAHWDKTYRSGPISEISRMYERLFLDPQLKVLYHTAEQMKAREENGEFVNDARTVHRHRTRNIVGTNSPDSDIELHFNPASTANTVGEVPGYFWYSAGFNLSANENGCFVYQAKGKTYRYDISLYDVEPDPSHGPVWGSMYDEPLVAQAAPRPSRVAMR
ncbi:MAG: hypothetical protein HY078_09120 [Elusimicrobia bacterium]|nr:hypothetical protein [Elusimicrobiota bacterium]